MSTLLLQRLFSGATLKQDFSFKLQTRYNVGSIAPYLYVHNIPAGTFTLTLKQGETALFEGSFTSAEMKAAIGTTQNYFHVFYPVIAEPALKLERGTYTIELTSSGYEYEMNSFVGWIQQHENLNNELDYEPASDVENPLAFRIKVYKEGIR